MAAHPTDEDDYYFALPPQDDDDDDVKKKYDCDYFSDGVDKKNDRGWKAGKAACMANAEGKFGNEWDADVHEELLHLTQSGHMNKVYEYHLDKPETNKVVILGVCLSLFEESLAIDFERTGESNKRFIMKTEREGEEAYTTMMEKLLNVPERYLGPDGQPLVCRVSQKLMYSTGIPNNPTLPHQQHQPQHPSSSSSCITGPTGDIISRDESLERDADAHNADTFGCDDYDNALNDDDVMLSYTQPCITLKEIGSHHHPTPHHPTPNISIGEPLEGPPIFNNNNRCRSGYDRAPGHCMEAAAAAADQASMMMRDMPPPPGILRPDGLAAAGVVVPPPPGIMTRRPPITLASSSYLPTAPPPPPVYSDIRRRMADLRPPPGIHQRIQEGDVTVPPPPPPSFIPPLHQPLLSTQEYKHDVTRMMMKMSSSSSIEQERSSSSASMQDTLMFGKGMGRDDKDMSDAVQGEHPSSSSWMTEEEKDMVMKSQLNQMAQVNTGVQDRNGKFVFERVPSALASHTGNDDDDDGQRHHQSHTHTHDAADAIHHTSNSSLGNKIYSSIQHPRRNLNLTIMKDDCSSSTGRESEHHHRNDDEDDDPRWIIEEGFLQMMDVDICDKELSVLHPMAVDRIIHTLDTRTALLSQVMKGLKVMMMMQLSK
ncbi:hypothetical protein FOZ61_010911, partial [Perkinsus olseni]